MEMRHSFVKQKWNIFKKCLVCHKMFGGEMWRCVDCTFRCHARCAAGAVDYEMANRQSICTVNVNVNTCGSEPIELKDVPPSSVDRQDSTELVVVPEKNDLKQSSIPDQVEPLHGQLSGKRTLITLSQETFGRRHSAELFIHQENNTEFIFRLPILQNYILHDKTTLTGLSRPVVIRCPTTVHGTFRPNRLMLQQPPSEEHVATKTSTKNDQETIPTSPFAEVVAEMDRCPANDTAAEQSSVEVEYFFPEISEPSYNGYFFGGNYS